MSDAQSFTVQIQAKVWLWQGKGAWHFATLPLEAADQLKEIDRIGLSSLSNKLRRGWGSIPVQVALGSSRWETSIFPDKTSGSYILPIKAAIRKAQGIGVDDLVSITLSVPLP